MNAVPDAPPQSATGFWSIERFVAFILGPVVAAGAGWLSTFLAKELGVQLSSETIALVFGAGTLTAGGLAYKWLHGRQLEMSLAHNKVIAEIKASPAEGFITTTLKDLEGLAEGAAQKAVTAIHSVTPGGEPSEPGGVSTEPPIPAASGDPAPTTAADGAAQGQ